MRNRFGMSTILALLIFAFGSQGATAEEPAQDDFTSPGQFYNTDGNAAIFFVIAKLTDDNPQKSAGPGMKYQHLDDNFHFDGTYTTLVTGFYSAGDWQKFVSLWKKALAAPRAAEGADTDIGDYFDEPDKTLLSVATDRDGEISFTMGANPNENNVPQDIYSFSLSLSLSLARARARAPKDVHAFDRAMKKVSAYFGK